MLAGGKPYKAKFVQADDNGNYQNLTKIYSLSLTDKELLISKNRISLLKILQVNQVGNGVAIIYLNEYQIPTKIMLTTNHFLGISIGRAKKLNELVSVLKSAVTLASRGASPERLAEAQVIAPPDTCFQCGGRGGADLKFARIYSVVQFSRTATYQGCYCKKHATIHGLSCTAISAVFGWWSLEGIFITPVYLYRNLKSLWTHSNIPKVLVLILSIIAFSLPLLLVTMIIMAIMK
ncbi:MAG: hypothetical protein LBE62_15565 [Azonexus sp.]|jgi:hypothetical protein|nr:hypothetical protein [Azonexus sp.]